MTDILDEVKAAVEPLLEKQARIFEEFKSENDKLLQLKADNKAFADQEALVKRLEAGMAEQDKMILELQKKSNRIGGASVESQLTEEQLEHKSAFNRFLRKGDDSGLAELQRKALNTGTDSEGGYLVVPEMDNFIDRFLPTVSTFYRLANTITIGSTKWIRRVKTTGTAMRRTAEGAGGGETTAPTYAQIAIEVFPAEVEPWVENANLEDAEINLEIDLANEAAIGFAEGAGAEFISGNGVGKARGITSYTNVANSAFAWGKVGYIVSGKSAAFASVAPADKIIDLQHSLRAAYRPGATFLMNDATLGKARQIKDGSGTYYLWQPDPAGAFGGRFLGSPVEVDDNMADMAAGSFSIAFGNFNRAYTIVNRRGTVLIRDNITSKGVTKFNFTRRFGGGITNYEALKLFKMATS